MQFSSNRQCKRYNTIIMHHLTVRFINGFMQFIRRINVINFLFKDEIILRPNVLEDLNVQLDLQFVCTPCAEKFTSLSSLKMHILMKHYCLYCSKQFKFTWSYNNHRHRKYPFILHCSKCDHKCFMSKVSLLNHYQLSHPDTLPVLFCNQNWSVIPHHVQSEKKLIDLIQTSSKQHLVKHNIKILSNTAYKSCITNYSIHIQ